MYTSIIYENQKTFTVFDIQGSAGIQPIERITYNGVNLVRNVDYAVTYPISSIAVVSSLAPFFKTSDDLDIRFYAEDNVTLIDSFLNIPINFNYSYVEISGDASNGVFPGDTTDKSSIMNTPLEVRGCENIDVNGHLLHIINIGGFTDGQSAPIILNGNPATSGDFNKSTHPSLLPLSFDGSGVLTESAGNVLIEFASVPKISPYYIETTRNRNDQLGIDAFLLDGIGFRELSHPDPKWVDINGNNHFITPTPAIGSTFRVEITSTHYNIICNGVTLVSYPRNVIYTSDKGTITPSGTQPYLTGVDFIPTSYGLGEIKATFGQISAKQVINVIIPRQPNFGGTTFGNTCPTANFNLNTLVDSNLQSGVGLTTRFYSDASHVNELPSTNITSVGSHTIYAFQHDSSNNCWSTARQITVNIISCELSDPDIPTVWEGTIACNSHTVNPVINNNYPNPTYQWWRDGVQVASTLNYTITQSGNYTFHIYNTGTSDHYQKSGNVTIYHNLVFTTNLPSTGTAGNSYSVIANYPSEVTSIIWEKYNGSTWDVISGANTYSYTPTTSGQYRIRITNFCGTITSNILSIGYSDPVIITDWEGSYCNSHSVTPIITNNYPSPTYEWKRNGVVVATTLTYNITQSGIYLFTVSDGSDSVSKSGTVTINHTLSYTTNLPASSGVGNLLTVVVNYPAEVTSVVWQRFNTSTFIWENVATSGYSYTPTTSGEYRVITTNPCGSVNSNNTIVSFGDPVINTDWDGITQCDNYLITPSITNNYPVPVYEWRRNGVVVANTLSYTVASSGTYQFTVSQDGSSVSKSGTVTITPSIQFTQNLPGSIAEPQTLTVVVDHPELVTDVKWKYYPYGTSDTPVVVQSGSYSFIPEANGYYFVEITGSCNTIISNTTHIWIFANNDSYNAVQGVLLNGNVSLNDNGCEDSSNPDLRTFYVILLDTFSPSEAGELIGFNENTGSFTYSPNSNFVGTVTFDYEIYCTLDDTNNIDLAFAKDVATVTINVSCGNGIEDFQIEYDPIAYIGGKTCYESYEIVNVFPEDADISNVIIETEGIEITQPYDSITRRFIGKITQKKSVKVIVTIVSCNGQITREIVQKVSLKPCCD